jgi:hypothetical protein
MKHDQYHEDPECGDTFIMDKHTGDHTLDKFSKCSRADMIKHMEANIHEGCMTDKNERLGNTGVKVPSNG